MAQAWVAAAAMAAYRGAWRTAWPLIAMVVKRRDRLRGVAPSVAAERLGWSERPAAWGTARAQFTLWIHGASVGECLSALPLVELALAGRLAPPSLGDARVVVTTTTPAARALLQTRLSDARARCVFAPLDHPASVRRFLEAWQPDAGLWIESELWPTLVAEAEARGVAVGLVNARMSPRSLRRWRLPIASSVARRMLGAFSLVLCQDEPNRQRLTELGAARAESVVNLKFASAAAPVTAEGREKEEEGDDDALVAAVGARPVWAAVSTHEGEEELMVATHVALATRLAASDLLTVVVPRHPERSVAIAEALRRKFPSVSVALRSECAVPSATTAVFIVDALGETRRVFAATRAVVMGGSFAPRGGHNPLEPLRAGCQVLVGPHMDNFADVLGQLKRAGLTDDGGDGDGDPARRALLQLPSADASALADALHARLCSPAAADAQQQQARALAALASTTLSTHERKLREWLESQGR